MKYIIIKDLYNVFIDKIIIFLLFIILLSTYPLYVKYIINIPIIEIKFDIKLLSNIGGNYNIEYLVEIFLTLSVISYFIFSTIRNYIDDIRYGKENIFLRIDLTQWIKIKLLSIIIFSFLLELILFLILISIWLLIGVHINITNTLILIFTDYLMKIILQFIGISMILLIGKYGLSLLFFILLLPIIIKNNVTNIFKYLYTLSYSNNLFLLIIILIIVCITTFYINKYSLLKFFEEEEI